MAVYMTGLPEALPNPAAIDDAAWDVRSVGVYSDSIRDEVQGEWKNLGAVFKSPHQDRVYSAVTKVMGPYIDATMALTDDAAKALEAFADDMTALRSRFENIRSRAATHNAVPFVDQDTEYWQDNTEVQNEVDAVAGLYDAAVDRCASALRKLNPSMPGGLETAATVAGKMGDGKELLKAAGLGASHFTFRDGKLFFSFTQTSTPGQPLTRTDSGLMPSCWNGWGCRRAISSAFTPVKDRTSFECRTTPHGPCSETCIGLPRAETSLRPPCSGSWWPGTPG